MSEIIPQHELNELLRIFGNGSGEPNCYIYFAKLCSCIAEKNGSFDPECPYCTFGYIYDTEPTEELVLRTSMNLKFMTDRQIHIYQGGARITIPKYNLAGELITAYSRITQGDVIAIKGDVRRDRDICELERKDYLLAFDVEEVLSVSEKQKEFKKDIDYTVSLDRKKTTIEWLDKDKPSSFYTVEFTSLVNYLVWDDMAKNRGGMDSDLPKMIMCRLRPYMDSEVNIAMSVDTEYENQWK